ncbi:hypothetical protein [Streptomyces sp. NPDC058612]|uniref:hypothetical protein n=1 Tax=Streptomyces sp. NPDC058612 TaxID=3346555 RepID=UPI003652F1CF
MGTGDVDEAGSATARRGLTEGDQALFRGLAAGQQPPSGTDLSRLAAEGLIDSNPYLPGEWIATDPRAAIQRVLEAERLQLANSLRRLDGIHLLEGLSPAFEHNRRFDSMGSEFLPTKPQMNDRIGEVTGRAAVELLAAQPVRPADRDPATHKLGTDRSLAALQRGASLRLLYRANAAADPATRAYVAALVEAGGEVRALAPRFPRFVIIDQKSLFIDDHVTGHAETHSGWHVADRSSVMWARHVFDLLWEDAAPWAQAVAAAGEGVLQDQHLDVLEQLNGGHSQEETAKRLAKSHRWVSDNLASARRQLGLRSTFQLMAWYGRWLERNSRQL